MSETYPFQIPSGISLIPDISGTSSLGSASKPFDKAYLGDVILISGSPGSEAWISGNAVATAVSDTASFFVASGTYTQGLNNSHYFTTTANPMRITFIHPEPINAVITATSSLSVAGNNQVIQAGILLDGVIQGKSIQERNFPNSDVGPIPSSMLVQLVSGNYIQLGIRNTTATNNPTVSYCNLSILGL
jgi:hypothetical protein